MYTCNNDAAESFCEQQARFGIKRFNKFFDADQYGVVIDDEFTAEVGNAGGGHGGDHVRCAGDAVNDPQTGLVIAGPWAPADENWDGVEEPEPDQDFWSDTNRSYREFRCAEDGVYQYDPQGAVKICGPLRVVQHVDTNGDYSRQVMFQTIAGKNEMIIIPAEALVGNSLATVKQLARRGLEIVPRMDSEVTAYLQSSTPDRIAIGATVPGWQDDIGDGQIYLLPDRTVIKSPSLRSSTNVIPAPSFPATPLSAQGTLATWRTEVAAPACQIKAGILALCAGFAPPLLKFAPETLNCVLNFYSKTSKGKSTMLQVAASVWGHHKQELMDWNCTEKGLLDRAKHYQDRPLFLDELGAGEFTPPAWSKLLYSLAGGKGRVRSSSQGKAIGGEAFRTFAISSGEFPIRDYMTGAKQRPNRGTLLRGMDIEIADAAEELPEEQREPFMAKLKQATKTAFGTAAKAFLQGLVEQYPQADDLNRFVVAKVAEILNDFDLPLQDAAIKRGLERFALLAVAGELAVQLRLLPLGDAKQVRKAIKVYAAAWYQTHSPQSVQQRLIEHIVSFIYSSEKRFQSVAGPPPANRVGWDCLIKGVPCFAFTSDGLKEASNESDVSMVAKLLQGAGLLVQNDPSKLKARLPKGNRLYCYAVKKDILSYSDEVA